MARPASYTFYTEGTHQVTLTVFDGRGGTGTDTLTITAGATGPPAAPSELLAIPSRSDWINMTWWTTPNNEDGFKVEPLPGNNRCLRR